MLLQTLADASFGLMANVVAEVRIRHAERTAVCIAPAVDQSLGGRHLVHVELVECCGTALPIGLEPVGKQAPRSVDRRL